MILIVDDSNFMRDAVNLALSIIDAESVMATNGQEGLAVFQSEKIDLIITDINMPEMDGLTFIKEVRKLNKEVPIIVLSTESEQGIQKEAADLGANGWIIKPFKGPDLIKIVKELLDE
ncbi:MAG: response regulator [Leptospiraceae bacterium]|nr:response regulator [Leptospiraceae bacterium]